MTTTIKIIDSPRLSDSLVSGVVICLNSENKQWEVNFGDTLKGKRCASPSPFSLLLFCCSEWKETGEKEPRSLMTLWGRAPIPAPHHLCKGEVNFSLVQPTVIGGLCYMYLKWYPNGLILLFL